MIIGAQRVLAGTNRNCSGGVTPWGTWLSCEEVAAGTVWEVDPAGINPPVQRPALGTFNHEAACVDPVGQRVYLTEDMPDGCLYRFTPTAYPDLSAGQLEVAIVAGDNSVTWGRSRPGRRADADAQPGAGATRFNGGEGMPFDDGKVYFTTKGDRKVWIYDVATTKIEVLYDLALADSDTPLREVDNTVVSLSGDLFICEDGDNFEICLITPDRYVSAFLRLDPAIHGAPGSNEMSGVCFDPSGSRMYFAAQRSFGAGALYEVSGPFRVPRPRPADRSRAAGTPTPRDHAHDDHADPTPPAAAPRDTTKPRVRIRSLVAQLSIAHVPRARAVGPAGHQRARGHRGRPARARVRSAGAPAHDRRGQRARPPAGAGHPGAFRRRLRRRRRCARCAPS